MSHRATRCIALFALAVPIGAALAPSGLAQEGAVLEEILVTAQRRETALQETPVAITVFSGERIQDLGIFNVADLSGRAPNTTTLKQPASNANTSLRIRGVGSGETSLLVDPKAGLYIDGAYLSKTVGAVFDLVDLEGMEVLRGAHARVPREHRGRLRGDDHPRAAVVWRIDGRPPELRGQ